MIGSLSRAPFELESYFATIQVNEHSTLGNQIDILPSVVTVS